MQPTLELARDRATIHHSDDGRAVAVWTEPGVDLLDDPQPFVDVLTQWVPDRVDAALAGMGACQTHQPIEPARVLHLLAVHPELQGRGFASRLLAPTLARSDAETVTAYLETSNPPNITFYERHGFEALAEVSVSGGGPTMWPLNRSPASVTPVRSRH